MTAPAPFPTPDAWLEHRVSYGETDAMGVVYYAEYLHLFERCRSLLIRERGMSYAEVERRGVLLPVVEAGCKYRASARFDDLIWIRCAISQWSRVTVRFVYEIYNEPREKILATGFTEHACLSPAGKILRAPEWLKALFTD